LNEQVRLSVNASITSIDGSRGPHATTRECEGWHLSASFGRASTRSSDSLTPDDNPFCHSERA